MNPFKIVVGRHETVAPLEVFDMDGNKIGEYKDSKDKEKPYHIIKEVIQG